MKRNLIILMTVIVMLFASCEENIPNVYDIYFTGTEREMEQVPEGIPYTIPTDIPMKEGHDLIIFLDGTEVIPGQSIMLDSDIILECSYVRKNCTVSFTGIGRASVEVPINSEYTVPSDIPAKEGCHTVIKYGDTEVKAGDKILIEEDTELDVTYINNITFSTSEGTLYETAVVHGGSYTIPALSEINGTREGYFLRIRHGETIVTPGDKIENITSDVTFSCEWVEQIIISFRGIEGIPSELVPVGTDFNYPIINDYYISSYKVGAEEKKMGAPAGKATEDIVIDLIGEKATEGLSVSSGVVSGCMSTSIVIPNYTADQPVTGIEDYAFYSGEITKLLIPETVTTIGESAFESCTGLIEELRLHGSVTIGARAFFGCPIETLYIEGADTNIGNEVFSGCKKLTSVSCTGNNTVIGESAFSGCSMLESFSETEVKSIGALAFSGCNAMTDVSIGGTGTQIGVRAFAKCQKLGNVSITGSDTVVGANAFCDCPLLKNVSLTGSGMKIEENAFARSDLSGTFDISGVISIGNNAFGETGIKAVVIEEGVTIDEWSFGGCGYLTSVIIKGTGTTDIPTAAFNCCTELNTLTITGVRSIGDSSFSSTKIKSLVLDDHVENIAQYAFSVSEALESVTCAGSAAIGRMAFASCANLKSISLTGAGTTLGERAFSDCDLTGKFDISGVRAIGSNVFNNCKMTKVTIPATLETIGTTPFSLCPLANMYFESDALMSANWTGNDAPIIKTLVTP